jgi:Protein of unknown function (DUF1207)
LARAEQSWMTDASASSVQLASWNGDSQYGSASPVPAAVDLGAWDGNTPLTQPTVVADGPPAERWIAAPADRSPYVDTEVYGDPGWEGREFIRHGDSGAWCWQVLPDGLIYHSYWAGMHEPRLALTLFGERDGRSMWDGTLGGRVGLWRYGTTDAIFPQGWQLDVEAAAIVRLDLDEVRDMNSVDYRGGVPLTYGIDNWQFKFGYYHLSSHMADEFAINNPGALDDRINYVRDSLVAGASYYPHPWWRLYAEVGFAFFTSGGAEPWEFQFGTEWSQPGPTGLHGAPFVALNAHLREEVDFGGDVTVQAGWMWRGNSGQTMRLGPYYFNGKSSQFQTFNDSEEQIGFGLWYDY